MDKKNTTFFGVLGELFDDELFNEEGFLQVILKREAQKEAKRKEKALKAKKAQEDWKNTPILLKILVWTVLLLPFIGIASCCLRS